jgi:hypothetical protein
MRIKEKRSAAKPWTHPRLGTFNANSGGWSAKVNVPEFAAFSYDTGYSNAPRSTGDIALGIHYHLMDAEVPASPPAEMVELLDKVMADPRALVDRVVTALWDDFNGRGPDSRVWWRGNMETVNKQFNGAGLPPPKGPQDLLPALQLTSLSIFNQWWDYPTPILYLDFYAAFEEEHNVSMLGDADRMLGMGFGSGDVSLWKELRKTKPRNPFV